ncbi:MAG: tRNA lysidine(34) synthetase TilS [Chloroflexota bacterium]
MATEKQQITLEQQVACFIRKHNLFPTGSRLLLAVSGGPDSTCLLYILLKLRQELGIELHVAHLDHQLRGKESGDDATYVAKLAGRLGVPATIEKRDAKAYKKEKRISLEEAAREVRYRFLSEVAGSVGADYIVTGHTLDDNVETVLMHIIRGTGTRGLIGLKPYSQWQLDDKRINITRPLLEISRQQTVNYCKENEIMPRLDTSNLSMSPLRNRIRQQLLPLLKGYNSGVAEALLRMAAIANDEIVFLDAEVARLWPAVVAQKEGIIALNKDRLNELPLALKRHLLRAVVEEIIGSLKDIETRHIEEILAALNKPAGRQINLPGGLIFSIEYDRYLLGMETVNTCPYPVIGGEYRINIPGKTELPGWLVEAEIMKPGAMEKEENDFVAYLDLDKAGNELKVRCRKPADRFQPLGMAETKKLNGFMIDTKIPRRWRQQIPIVFSPQQILWLVGYRIDDRVKVSRETKNVLRLEFKKC